MPWRQAIFHPHTKIPKRSNVRIRSWLAIVRASRVKTARDRLAQMPRASHRLSPCGWIGEKCPSERVTCVALSRTHQPRSSSAIPVSPPAHVPRAMIPSPGWMARRAALTIRPFSNGRRSPRDAPEALSHIQTRASPLSCLARGRGLSNVPPEARNPAIVLTSDRARADRKIVARVTKPHIMSLPNGFCSNPQWAMISDRHVRRVA